jgi:NADPH:quinone reductase-like Zn-dependent oxidoreductase
VKVIPLSLVTRLALSLIPDGKKAPLAPDSSKPNDEYRTALASLLEMLASGRLRPLVAERFSLLEASRAHEFMERGGYAGKVVLVANDG